jgi:hypothetical protein
MNPVCGAEFFGARSATATQGRFCSIRCSRRGDWNPQWRGDQVGYRGAHRRVQLERGKASSCSIAVCVVGSSVFHWANLTGRYADVSDYESLCVFHHRAYDWARLLGMSPQEAMERVAAIPADVQRTRSPAKKHS